MYPFIKQVSDSSIVYTFLFDGKKVGSVIYKKGVTCYFISYHVYHQFQGQGLGDKFLSLTLTDMKLNFSGQEVRAVVISDNHASNSILRKNKFTLLEDDGAVLEYKLCL